MALSQLQLRIERSIFEAIRLVLVAEQYIPDISNTGTYGNPPYDTVDEATWKTAIDNIKTAKGFAVEVFGHSQTKGLRKAPRIVIVPRRTMPGDIGSPMQPYILQNPTNPNQISKTTLPGESTHMYLDIHLVSASAAQDRILNAVLAKALGNRKFLTYYDDPTDRFFIRNYNYYDIPDTLEGQEEKVYAYEVPDLYNLTEDYISVPLISEITLELKALGAGAILGESANIIGPYIDDGGLTIDLTGIQFN